MQKAKLEGVSRRKGTKTTRRGWDARPARDLVDWAFTATDPNQLWVADFTCVPTWAGFMYLAIVLDVWSRRVVGWTTGVRDHHGRGKLVTSNAPQELKFLRRMRLRFNLAAAAADVPVKFLLRSHLDLR